jgi:hypothetical protein
MNKININKVIREILKDHNHKIGIISKRRVIEIIEDNIKEVNYKPVTIKIIDKLLKDGAFKNNKYFNN